MRARDEVAVLLDAAAGRSWGTAPDSSFEAQVRAAGSILQAHAAGRPALRARGQRWARSAQDVHSHGAEWRRVRAARCGRARRFRARRNTLADESAPAARALEVVVVTARSDAGRSPTGSHSAPARGGASRSSTSTPAEWRSARTAPEPLLLRLQAIGIPLAVVRRGDDLADGWGRRRARRRHMARTALLFVLPAFLVATHWARLEEGAGAEPLPLDRRARTRARARPAARGACSC